MKDNGNDYLIYPKWAITEFPDDLVSKTEIIIGEDGCSSCNLAVGDIDGDGLDEIATPISIGEEDCIRLYRGDGSLVWENTDVQLYHAYYNDRRKPEGGIGHMWYKRKHRHVLTEIVDFDHDGKMEVVVGDGPVYVLDGATGAIKKTFDLGGLMPLWEVVYDSKRGHNILFATVDDKKQGPRVTAVTPEGETLWSKPTPGKGFCDCMHNGDLNADGRLEVGFSVEEANEFRIMDLDGNVIWRKNTFEELGDDEHVDDFVIEHILPLEEDEKAQIFMAPGPNLVKADGEILWQKDDDQVHHAQKAMAVKLFPETPGMSLFTAASYRRKAHLLDYKGNELWNYDNFTKSRPAYCSDRHGEAIGRLTTACTAVDWNGNGSPLIAVFEGGGLPDSELQRRKNPIPPDQLRRFVHFLDRDGNPQMIFPIEDYMGCAIPGRLISSKRQSIVCSSNVTPRIFIFSKKEDLTAG